MPHFHIPLQSGSDEVLKLMHRRYDTTLFRYKINKVKELMPDAFIGVDVIVGTRGERPELFEEARQFIESLDVSQLHVFSYSERPGTKALEIPYAVKPEVKHERSQVLLALSEQKTKAFYEKFMGTVRPVLLEHAPKGRQMHGFTDNYIRVELPNREELNNQIVSVRLGGWNAKGDALKGELL
jgi:threonylcarbamoyladenosine tRNA methylthiotransferase MtaB